MAWTFPLHRGILNPEKGISCVVPVESSNLQAKGDGKGANSNPRSFQIHSNPSFSKGNVIFHKLNSSHFHGLLKVYYPLSSTEYAEPHNVTIPGIKVKATALWSMGSVFLTHWPSYLPFDTSFMFKHVETISWPNKQKSCVRYLFFDDGSTWHNP